MISAFGVNHGEISKMVLRRVWHSTLPGPAKNMMRHGPKPSKDGLMGPGVYATAKKDANPQYRRYDTKGRGSHVPMYVSGNPIKRNTGAYTGDAVYHQSQVIDVGRPHAHKYKPPNMSGVPQV